MITFDYPAYKAAFRAACTHYAIDPDYGATSYQAALVRADRVRQTYRAQPRAARRWWLRPELWLPAPPYRSRTERRAITRVFLHAYRQTLGRDGWHRRRPLVSEWLDRIEAETILDIGTLCYNRRSNGWTQGTDEHDAGE